MSIRHPHFEEIDARLRENAAELVAYLTGSQPNKKYSRQGEIRFGRKGGVAVVVAGHNKGRITPFDGEGKGLSPFQFIMQEQFCPFPQAVEWAADWLGLSSDYKADHDAERRRKEKRERERREADAFTQAEEVERTAIAAAIWKATENATGTPVEAYLMARGITAALPPDIRFLPPLFGSYGAMVVAARDKDGNIRAVQRVFIHDGKKAPVDTPKRTNGLLAGAAVRLPARQGEELVLAEGPETGLSVWQSWGRETWIALGSIASLVEMIPAGRVVVIARDADKPGSPADKALIKALVAMTERGIAVRIASPPNPTRDGYDFNDALIDYGNKTVAQALNAGGWIKPRYPAPTGTVEDARLTVNETFTVWSAELPRQWAAQAAFDSYMADCREG